MIVLRAKNVQFDVTYINLRDKPEWFLQLSPHGKVPVLKVDDEPLFESNAIAEYLDEVIEPHLHPQDAIKRARNRAWTDFVPDFAAAINLYYVDNEAALAEKVAAAPAKLERVEKALANERGNDGPYFNGDQLCLVDAAYAPFLQRFSIVEERLSTGLLDNFPLLSKWRDNLLATELVTGSVPENFLPEFAANLQRRGSLAAKHFTAEAAD